jgi:hypothetical protein
MVVILLGRDLMLLQVGQPEARLLEGTAEDGRVGLLEAYVLRYPGVGGQR